MIKQKRNVLTSTSNVLKHLWATITKNVVSTSARKSLNRTDWLKLLRNALFVGTTSSVVFILENLAENLLTAIGQGLVLALLNGVVDLAFRYIKNNDNKVDLNDNQSKES